MGSSVSCSVVLDPTDKFFYWTGETVSGHVVVTNSRSLKIRSINVNIIGQLIYTETRGSGMNTHTVTVRQNFYVEQHPVHISPTYGISYDEDGYYLEANTYQWPFSMHLAKYLPPSLLRTKVPYIDYFVEATVYRPSFLGKGYAKVPILIAPRVPRPRNVWSLEGEQSNFRDLYVYGKVLRNYFLIGEPCITLELYINNPSQTTIKEIIVKLVQRRKLAHKGGTAIIFEQTLPDIEYFHGTHLHQTFQIPVPPSRLFAPTSYIKNPEKPNLPWIVHYILEVTFKTNLFLTNLMLEFPLIIANSVNKPRTIYRHTVR